MRSGAAQGPRRPITGSGSRGCNSLSWSRAGSPWRFPRRSSWLLLYVCRRAHEVLGVLALFVTDYPAVVQIQYACQGKAPDRPRVAKGRGGRMSGTALGKPRGAGDRGGGMSGKALNKPRDAEDRGDLEVCAGKMRTKAGLLVSGVLTQPS